MSREIKIAEHASDQASRRGLSETTVLDVARAPEQRVAIRPGREIRQSRITLPAGGKMYRTSRIDKYWSG